LSHKSPPTRDITRIIPSRLSTIGLINDGLIFNLVVKVMFAEALLARYPIFQYLTDIPNDYREVRELAGMIDVKLYPDTMASIHCGIVSLTEPVEVVISSICVRFVE
jgi:hypothetical protein